MPSNDASTNGLPNGNHVKKDEQAEIDIVKQHANWANCVPVDTEVYGTRPADIPEGDTERPLGRPLFFVSN